MECNCATSAGHKNSRYRLRVQTIPAFSFRPSPNQVRGRDGQYRNLAQATRLGMCTHQVKVNHFPRRYGKQSGANVHVIIKAFRELGRLWRKLRHVAPDQPGLYSATKESSTGVDISIPLQK